MQLTNILRDIKEDYLRKRVYLPQDEIRACGVTEEDIRRGIVSNNVKELLRFQVRRTRGYYAKAEQGIGLVPGARSRLVICLISRIYAGILDQIEKSGFDVFSKRQAVSRGKKIATALAVLTKGEYL
jgi:phytoene synthase